MNSVLCVMRELIDDSSSGTGRMTHKMNWTKGWGTESGGSSGPLRFETGSGGPGRAVGPRTIIGTPSRGRDERSIPGFLGQQHPAPRHSLAGLTVRGRTQRVPTWITSVPQQTGDTPSPYLPYGG